MIIVPTDLSPVQIKVNDIPGIKTETDKITAIKAVTDNAMLKIGTIKVYGNINTVSLTELLNVSGCGTILSICERNGNSGNVTLEVIIDGVTQTFTNNVNDTTICALINGALGSPSLFSTNTNLYNLIRVDFKSSLILRGSRSGVADANYSIIYSKN